MQPVVIVDDVSRRDEYADQPHIRKCVTWINVTSDATHAPQLWIANNTTSMLFIIRRLMNLLYTGTSAVSLKSIGASAVPPAGVNALPLFKNQRLAGIPSAIVQAAGNQGVSAVTTFMQWPATTLEPTNPWERSWSCDLVLPPGEAFLLHGSDFAQTLFSGIEWEELPLDPV